MQEQDLAARAASNVVIEQATEIVSSYVSKNSLPANELPSFIAAVHAALSALGRQAEVEPAPAVAQKPAVPINKSVTRDYIVCLEDGKKFSSMRRHLSMLGMTPDEYRAKWRLPSDYPMVCADYSERRSTLAKESGLGSKSAARKTVEEGEQAVAAAPKRRGRPAKAA